MDLAAFKSSLKAERPPPDCGAAVTALWWAAKGDWAQAHELAQEDDAKPGWLVHAYLHRVEGDLTNAAYWYKRAGAKPATGSLDAEWAALAGRLLRG